MGKSTVFGGNPAAFPVCRDLGSRSWSLATWRGSHDYMGVARPVLVVYIEPTVSGTVLLYHQTLDKPLDP